MLMANKIVEAVKKAVTKKPAKEVVEKKVPAVCKECNGRGLQNEFTLCADCSGSGIL